jgi:hypothetical protein
MHMTDTYIIISRWSDGDILTETPIGCTLAEAAAAVDERTARILRLSFDGTSYTTTDASYDAAMLLLGDDSPERDDLSLALMDFIDTHAPGEIDTRLMDAHYEARHERLWSAP